MPEPDHARDPLDALWLEPPAPPRRSSMLMAALTAAALGTALACGWLGATLLNPPLVLTGPMHLWGCEP